MVVYLSKPHSLNTVKHLLSESCMRYIKAFGNMGLVFMYHPLKQNWFNIKHAQCKRIPLKLKDRVKANNE